MSSQGDRGSRLHITGERRSSKEEGRAGPARKSSRGRPCSGHAGLQSPSRGAPRSCTRACVRTAAEAGNDA
eukprot:6412039-Alexandrium_andersonii.AAC.1